MIYLDNAATTFPKPEAVYSAMDFANRNQAFNAGRGSYKASKDAMMLIDDVKQKLISLVHANPNSKVVLTPSITIALNEIIQGVDLVRGANIYVSPYEHNAVARVVNLVAESKEEINIIELPIDARTKEIDIAKTKYLFAKNKPSLVCCVHMSNVTGYILPVAELFELAKNYDAITVLDTAQSLGIIDVDASEINADFIAFAGHKSLYGPLGIGGFVITPNSTKLKATFAGGTGSNSLNLDMPQTSPERYEFASKNIIAVAGLIAALDDLNVEKNYKHEDRLTKKLIEGLKEIDGVRVYSENNEKYIGVVSFNVDGYSAEDVGSILDSDYDIAVRTGYHCAPYIHKYLDDKEYVGTVRVGISQFNTDEEIESLLSAISEL